jgi:hypothetical protein
MSDKTDSKKKTLLEALEKSLGVVTDACKMVDISRDTHYRWLKEDETYREAVEEIEGVAVDFAESQLYDKISKGDTTAIIFYLKTKGKKRGYIERSEIDHTSKGEKIVDTKEMEEKLDRALKVLHEQGRGCTNSD